MPNTPEIDLDGSSAFLVAVEEASRREAGAGGAEHSFLLAPTLLSTRHDIGVHHMIIQESATGASLFSACFNYLRVSHNRPRRMGVRLLHRIEAFELDARICRAELPIHLPTRWLRCSCQF